MLAESISHYRIVDTVGSGGMGIVYRAYDQQLEREVAIKVLSPGLLADESARKRFRKEALALARLNHPNIATIFEFGSEKGRDFLVTEYIPGITLNDKLALGPMTFEDGVAVGLQISVGLIAAHERGLVHRDLKPGNVRLMPDGRVKILDFGLAQLAPRPSAGDTVTLTRTHEVAGTLPYMAPEQLRGTGVDPRSDIWAAGALMYEMVTGKRPFPDPSAPVLINAILNLPPIPPSKAGTNLPPEIDHVILKALEKDPALRYQSADELRIDLERLGAGKRPVSAKPKKRNYLPPVAIALLLIVIAASAYFLVPRLRLVRGTGINRRSVAIMGFKNLGQNKQQDWLSTALSEMLTTEMAAGSQLRAIPGTNVARARSDLQLASFDNLDPEMLSKVKRALGADIVVLGSYLDLDGQIRVDVRVQDASAGETLTRFSDTGTEAQLFDLVRHLGETLRDKCGAGPVTAEQASSIRATEPENADLARLFSQGLAELRSYNAIPARDLLTQAIAKDPKYALAHEALAEASSQLGYDQAAKDESKRAFDLSSGLPRPQASAIEARYWEESRQWNKAVDIYKSLWTIFPDDPEYGLLLSNAEVSAGRGNDALGTIEKLRKFPAPMRDDPRIDLAEASAARSLSDYRRDAAAAEAAIRKAQQLGSTGLQAEGLLQLCWALRNVGDPERAKTTGRQAGEILAKVGDFRGQARSLTCVGDVLADQGQLAPAQQMHEQALELARKIGAQKDMAGALINVGNVLAAQQKFGDSTRQYKLALSLALSIGDQSDALLAQNNLGANLSSEGDFTGARKYFEDSVHTAESIGDQAGIVEALINRSYVSSLEGDLSTAKQDLQRALQIARDLHLKSRVATILSGLGDIQFAQDELQSAKSSYSEALQLRKELGEKGGIANSQASLANLALEQGDAAQAETLAREAAHEFENESDADQRTAAEDVLIRALLAQHKYDQAQQQIAAVKALGARDVPTTLALGITNASLLTDLHKNAEAEHELQQLRKRAEEKGLFNLECQARIALAKSQVEAGETGAARATLDGVSKQAAPRGFRLLARKASQLRTSMQR